MKPPQYFSRLSNTLSTRGGNLPHWSQQCATFVTFRLADSLPDNKLDAYREEQEVWVSAHPEPWDVQTCEEYQRLFPDRFQSWLDSGYGECLLKNEKVREIVEVSLNHFAEKRYSLYSYVVMPNHVHVLFMPEEGFDGREIVSAWKRFTAKEINKLLNRQGSVWQKESYDRLVRDVEEFNTYRSYIRSNNEKLAFDAYLS